MNKKSKEIDENTQIILNPKLAKWLDENPNKGWYDCPPSVLGVKDTPEHPYYLWGDGKKIH